MKIFIASMLLLPFSVLSQTVKLDGASTTVKFDIEDVEEGTVSGIKIDADLNLDDPSKSWIKATADASTLNTGSSERDKHITHDAEGGYIDVTATPTFKFETSKIVKTESGWMAYGKLTIGGVTQDVTMPFIKDGKKLVGRIKIHTGNFGIHADKPSDPSAINCIIRIETTIK